MKNGLKVGVIGLSTIETPKTTSTFNDGTFPAYQFQNYTSIVIEKSQ
jgi:2',3'-cyclic-nucleotide 2'-phosphodiesterase (5'-nucleotidase family)